MSVFGGHNPPEWKLDAEHTTALIGCKSPRHLAAETAVLAHNSNGAG